MTVAPLSQRHGRALGPATHDFDFTNFYEHPVKTGPCAQTVSIIAVWYKPNRRIRLSRSTIGTKMISPSCVDKHTSSRRKSHRLFVTTHNRGHMRTERGSSPVVQPCRSGQHDRREGRTPSPPPINPDRGTHRSAGDPRRYQVLRAGTKACRRLTAPIP
jgi:hypothetical protein